MDTRIFFDDARLGALELPNRMLMAPMTRNRSDERGHANELMAEYYAQRAGAGLIISEMIQVSPTGQGYPNTPGLHTDAQMASWRQVTEAVHEAGGRIFAQLAHAGRISHPSLQPGGGAPVAPSAIRPAGTVFTGDGMEPFVMPRALTTGEVEGVIEDFVAAARRARAAGFDGVELHGANGYLLDQFLRDGTNRRSDRFGGDAEARTRLLVETARAVAAAIGADRVGVRLSPVGTFNDMSDSDPAATFETAARRLGELGLAYLHVIETGPGADGFDFGALRAAFGGRYVAAGNYDRETGAEALREGRADFVAYARKFLANPDLPRRFRQNAPLTEPDPDTFYGGGAEGYTDYPTLEEARAA